MTKKRDLKARVRSRMEKTGEAYAAARAEVTKTGVEHHDPNFQKLNPSYEYKTEPSKTLHAQWAEIRRMMPPETVRDHVVPGELMTAAPVPKLEATDGCVCGAELGSNPECKFHHPKAEPRYEPVTDDLTYVTHRWRAPALVFLSPDAVVQNAREERLRSLPPIEPKALVKMLEVLKTINAQELQPAEARTEANNALLEFDERHPGVLPMLMDPREHEDFDGPAELRHWTKCLVCSKPFPVWKGAERNTCFCGVALHSVEELPATEAAPSLSRSLKGLSLESVRAEPESFRHATLNGEPVVVPHLLSHHAVVQALTGEQLPAERLRAMTVTYVMYRVVNGDRIGEEAAMLYGDRTVSVPRRSHLRLDAVFTGNA